MKCSKVKKNEDVFNLLLIRSVPQVSSERKKWKDLKQVLTELVSMLKTPSVQ